MKPQTKQPDTSKEGLQDKHTKGEWVLEIYPKHLQIISKEGGGICNIIHKGILKERHEANAELIVKAVNNYQSLVDALNDAKSAYFHLKMEINPKWDYAKDEYYQKFLTALNNSK